MNDKINIRVIKSEEIPLVGLLIRDTIRTSYSSVYPPLAIDFFLNYHTDESISQRRKSGIVIVAEWDGEILATGSLVGAEITGVFVRADLQGKNLGSLVMNRLESLATENGHKYVELSISLPSRGFYEKRGYRITQPASIDMGMGQSLDYWEGRKIFSMR